MFHFLDVESVFEIVYMMSTFCCETPYEVCLLSVCNFYKALKINPLRLIIFPLQTFLICTRYPSISLLEKHLPHSLRDACTWFSLQVIAIDPRQRPGMRTWSRRHGIQEKRGGRRHPSILGNIFKSNPFERSLRIMNMLFEGALWF